MATFKQLYRHTIFYTLATMIEAVAPLLLIPFLTHRFSSHDYGLWTLFQSSIAFLVPLIGLGYKDAIRMRYLHLSASEFSAFITSATLITVLLTLIGSVFVLMARTTLEDWFQLAPIGLFAMIGVAACYSFFYMAIAICQFADERRMFLILQAVQMTVSLGATVLLVIFGVGWKGCVYGKLAGLLTACILAATFLTARFRWTLHWHTLRQPLRELAVFAPRYLPYGLIFVVIPLTNRLLITHLVRIEDASFYALGESFAMALNLLIIGFMFAWQPWLFKKLAGHDADGMYSVRLACVLFIFGLPLAGALLSVIARLATPYLLGPQFQSATHYMFALMMATAASGYFLLAQSFVHFHHRIGAMSLASSIAMVANAALSWRLIPLFGAVGAAWATCISYLGAAVILSIIAWRIHAATPHPTS